MDDATSRGLIARALAMLAAGRPEVAGQTFAVPVERYLDPARLARERRLMRRHPQPVAASAELAQRGDWLARERFGQPLLLARAEDGRVHAFLNVCRHRGARVMPEGAGCGRSDFVCPYHAWRYGLDGALLKVPQAFGFPDLDLAAHGLRRLAVAERAGLVWVVTDPNCAEVDVEAQLGPLASELDAMGFAAHVPHAPRPWPLACNWKLVIDGSFEAYHFQTAHRATIAAMFPNNLQVVDSFGLHRRVFLPKTTLAAGAAGLARAVGNIIYFFFPNTLLLVQPDHAQLSLLEPVDAAHTIVHELTLLPEAPQTEKALVYWQKNIDLYRATLGEDYALAEAIQAGLASGANRHLTFGTFEFAAPQFHAQLDEHLPPA